MDRQRIKALRDSLQSLFKSNLFINTEKNEKANLKIDDNYINLISKIYNEITKEKKLSFLSKKDLSSIIYLQFLSFPTTEEKKSIDPDHLAKSIVDFILKLPLCYTIRLKIPLFKGSNELKVNEVLVSFNTSTAPVYKANTLNEFIENQSDKTDFNSGLYFIAKGYIEYDRNKSYNNALTFIKILIQRGLSEKIYIIDKENSYFKPHDDLTVLYKIQNIKRIPTYFLEYKIVSDTDFNKITLSDDLSCFLDRLKINTSEEFYKSRINDEGNIYYSQLIEKSLFLYNLESARAKCITSAIIWSFDSYMYEEKSSVISFLQICFGLEALYSDDAGSDIIVKTLSIKVSYSIARNIEDRELIKDLIKKIYCLRSKLVHGFGIYLNEEDLNLLKKARTLLDLCIDHEIKLLSN